MSYIPHTPEEIEQMLATIGVGSIEALFEEIPAELRCQQINDIPSQLSEMEVTHLMRERAEQDGGSTCFIGAGAYEHYIPAAVWELTTRGEFYSAYTPYQAEASQGTLQLLYEYQSMMTSLTGMDASNASLYDGASALAEAVLMAVRLSKMKSTQILMPATVHPIYRQVVHSLTSQQGVTLIDVPYDAQTGITDLSKLPEDTSSISALVIPQPNFFGHLEPVDELTDWAHQRKLKVIALVNPLTLSVLKSPKEWGETGADIVCGEGQPLGIPMSSGGPYFGFMCCKKEFVRQMPGRIVGRTVDLDGNTGFTLTLQAREQHIRRSKATSNICTNQGLMVTAATIHMSILGADGLAHAARSSYHNTHTLVQQLTALEGVKTVFNSPYFHEAVLHLESNAAVDEILKALAAQHGILAGYPLAAWYPELDNCILVCATEMRTAKEIAHYAQCLAATLAQADELPVAATI